MALPVYSRVCMYIFVIVCFFSVIRDENAASVVKRGHTRCFSKQFSSISFATSCDIVRGISGIEKYESQFLLSVSCYRYPTRIPYSGQRYSFRIPNFHNHCFDLTVLLPANTYRITLFSGYITYISSCSLVFFNS